MRLAPYNDAFKALAMQAADLEGELTAHEWESGDLDTMNACTGMARLADIVARLAVQLDTLEERLPRPEAVPLADRSEP